MSPFKHRKDEKKRNIQPARFQSGRLHCIILSKHKKWTEVHFFMNNRLASQFPAGLFACFYGLIHNLIYLFGSHISVSGDLYLEGKRFFPFAEICSCIDIKNFDILHFFYLFDGFQYASEILVGIYDKTQISIDYLILEGFIGIDVFARS